MPGTSTSLITYNLTIHLFRFYFLLIIWAFPLWFDHSYVYGNDTVYKICFQVSIPLWPQIYSDGSYLRSSLLQLCILSYFVLTNFLSVCHLPQLSLLMLINIIYRFSIRNTYLSYISFFSGTSVSSNRKFLAHLFGIWKYPVLPNIVLVVPFQLWFCSVSFHSLTGVLTWKQM